jgi:hypothetical protein
LGQAGGLAQRAEHDPGFPVVEPGDVGQGDGGLIVD